jgi:lipopolysaccharide/colanic/teichoic acid biosynthesis glycosyltransferase
MMKRLFDFTVSLVGLILLMPIFIILIIVIRIDSKGGPIFKQIRVGQFGKDFWLLKFRSMRLNSANFGLLTVGEKDPRITFIGYYLRKYKIDELPQLLNVLLGDMSLVGPRPEVRRYVDLYTKEQLKVLKLKPGITDIASIKYKNENEILSKSKDPETTYIKIIMSDKIKINLQSAALSRSLWGSIKIIFATLKGIFGNTPTINENE